MGKKTGPKRTNEGTDLDRLSNADRFLCVLRVFFPLKSALHALTHSSFYFWGVPDKGRSLPSAGWHSPGSAA